MFTCSIATNQTNFGTYGCWDVFRDGMAGDKGKCKNPYPYSFGICDVESADSSDFGNPLLWLDVIAIGSVDCYVFGWYRLILTQDVCWSIGTLLYFHIMGEY